MRGIYPPKKRGTGRNHATKRPKKVTVVILLFRQKLLLEADSLIEFLSAIRTVCLGKMGGRIKPHKSITPGFLLGAPQAEWQERALSASAEKQGSFGPAKRLVKHTLKCQFLPPPVVSEDG